MLPGTLLDPNSPGNDRFPVTIGDCKPMSGVDIPDDWYENPEEPRKWLLIDEPTVNWEKQ